MHRKLSPYAGVSFKPFSGEEFHVRFFYKDIFRLPSFNDLYYGQTGNIDLKPENARQLNVGLTYTKRLCEAVPYLTLTADAYVNRVTAKIVAIPTKNLFVLSLIQISEPTRLRRISYAVFCLTKKKTQVSSRCRISV